MSNNYDYDVDPAQLAPPQVYADTGYAQDPAQYAPPALEAPEAPEITSAQTDPEYARRLAERNRPKRPDVPDVPEEPLTRESSLVPLLGAGARRLAERGAENIGEAGRAVAGAAGDVAGAVADRYGGMKQALADYVNGTIAPPAAETERVVQAAPGATPGEKAVNAVLDPGPAAAPAAAPQTTGYAAAAPGAAGEMSPGYLDAAGGQALAGQASADAPPGQRYGTYIGPQGEERTGPNTLVAKPPPRSPRDRATFDEMSAPAVPTEAGRAATYPPGAPTSGVGVPAGAPGSLFGVPRDSNSPLVRQELDNAHNAPDRKVRSDPDLLRHLPPGYFDTVGGKAALERLARTGGDELFDTTPRYVQVPDAQGGTMRMLASRGSNEALADRLLRLFNPTNPEQHRPLSPSQQRERDFMNTPEYYRQMDADQPVYDAIRRQGILEQAGYGGELNQRQAAQRGIRIPRGTSVGRSGVPGNIPTDPEDSLRTDPRDRGPYGLISESGGGGRGGRGGARGSSEAAGSRGSRGGGGRGGGRRSELDQEQMPAGDATAAIMTGYNAAANAPAAGARYAAADTGTMTDAGPEQLAQAAPGYGSFTPGQAGGTTNTILPTRPGSFNAAQAPAQAPTQTRAQERAANEKIATDRANRVYSDGRPYSAADKAAADRGDQVNANREEYYRRLRAGEPTGIDTGYGRGVDYNANYDFSRPLPPRQAPTAQSMAERDEAVRLHMIPAPPPTAPMSAVQQKAAEASSKSLTETQRQFMEYAREKIKAGDKLTDQEQATVEMLRQRYETGIGGARAPARAASSSAAPGAAAQQPVRVRTPAEAARLPRGTPIIMPDGSTGVVP